MELKPNPMVDSKALIEGQNPSVSALFRSYIAKLHQMERAKVVPEDKPK